MTAPRPTTAELLGQYRKELIANGIPDDIADDIVRTAAEADARSGNGAFYVHEPVTA